MKVYFAFPFYCKKQERIALTPVSFCVHYYHADRVPSNLLQQNISMPQLEATEKFTVWGKDRVKAKPSEQIQETQQYAPSIVFSAHGDTCFGESKCQHVPLSHGAIFYGEMDNFAGVHAMMQAYFSGSMPSGRVQCQVTHGEEKATNGVFYAGAREVMTTLKPRDFVAVIDVTGCSGRSVSLDAVLAAPHVKGHVVIEKVRGEYNLL